MKRIWVIWVSIMLAFASAILIIDVSEDTEGKIVVNNGVKYVTHAPIRIDFNAEFDEAHGVVNWATGDGSAGNPWIIENWDINGSGIGTCIFIGNTTDYFEIKNCHLHHANGTFAWEYWINCGIHFYNVNNGEIDNNNVHSNAYGGLFTSYSDNNIITNNAFYDNVNMGIYSEASDYNTYDGNNISQNVKGLYLVDRAFNPSNFNKVINNTITDNLAGIHIDNSAYNTVLNNSVYKNHEGIYLYEATDCIIQGNNISDNNDHRFSFGLYLGYSDHNFVLNNTLINNTAIAIELNAAQDITVANNTIVKGGFRLRGFWDYYYNTHSIDESNTVNGKPVIYLKNQNGGSVPSYAGQVILGNCANISVNNFTFTDLWAGVLLGHCENITISNIVSTNGVQGIKTLFSHYNTIKNCTLVNNIETGLWLHESNRNDVYSNLMSFNEYGLGSSGNNNTFHNNNFSLNTEFGIYIWNDDNYIYNNNIIDNFNQSNDPSINFWNESFPIGGNYWSDYTGIDGNGDGFGDTPYTDIGEGSNVDYWPLMSPGPPTVNLTAPDGGEVWEAGTSHKINWTMSDVKDPSAALRVTLDYSIDGGVTFPFNIITNQTGYGAIPYYYWQVPDTPSTNCVMRVSVEDTTRNTVIDTSTAPFTILVRLPFVLAESPNSGESLKGGGDWWITWTATGGTYPLSSNPMTIEYSTNGLGGPWNLLADNEFNDGFYIWDPVPSVNENNCYVRITAEDTSGYTGEDTSNFSFEIDSIAPLPATNPYAELTGTNDVTIFWTESPSSDVDHYEIWFVQNGWDKTGDSYALLDSVPAGTTNYVHTNRGVNNSNCYAYQVRTYDAAGNEARTYTQAAKYGRTLQFAQSEWWLLSSCVVQSNTSLDHVIQGEGMPGAWDYALVWDTTTEQWISHLDGRPASLNELTDITNEMGFWLHTTGNARFTTAGYIANMSINLYAGWNLVGYPTLNNTETVANAFWGTGADAVMVCDTSEPYNIKEVAPNYVMKPGEGYWIHVVADTVWVIDW